MTYSLFSRRRGTHLAMYGIFACLLVVAPDVRAESSDRELSEQAQSHYDRGQKAYRSGDYETAAEQLRKAYALTPAPMLLYNISLAEWRAGNLEEAAATATRAVRADLPEGVAIRNRGRLAAFEVLGTAREAVASGEVERSVASSGRPTETEADAGRAFGTLGWIGVGLAGGGAATLGAAVWFDQRVGNAVDRMERARDRGEPGEANRILRNEVRPNQSVGRVLLVSGTALAATGAALTIVEVTKSGQSDDEVLVPGRASAADALRIAPQLGPHTVGLQLWFGPPIRGARASQLPSR